MVSQVKAQVLLVAFFTLFACSVSVFAAENFGTVKPEISVRAVQGSNSITEELAELKLKNQILEAQLQITKDYHSSLLDTVYWALAGVFVVVGLLLGFGWFANFRIYERDKDVLRKELRAQMETEVVNLKLHIDTHANEASEAQSKKLSETLEKSEKMFSSRIASLDSRVFGLELNIAREEMKAEKSPAMALTKALHILQLCVSRSQEDVPDTIHFMLKKIDEGGKFTANEITRVQKIVDGLPPHYAALIEKLQGKLVASDIF
jgi:hypothetical protein